MAIIIKFIGALRNLSGKPQLAINCQEGMLLKELISQINQQTPQLEKSIVDQEGKGSTLNALILVNGKEISVLKGLETSLNDGDEIVFVPVVHGG